MKKNNKGHIKKIYNFFIANSDFSKLRQSRELKSYAFYDKYGRFFKIFGMPYIKKVNKFLKIREGFGFQNFTGAMCPPHPYSSGSAP